MAVFPEQMERIDANDTAGSLRRIDSYIRYIVERVEFSMRNTTRSVNEAGVSNVTLYQQLLETVNAMSILQSALSGMQGEIKSLNTRVGEMQTGITGMQDGIAEMQRSITTMQADITDLKTRVTTLEGGGTEV